MELVATKERPVLFSGPMVKAILEGTKTQTRRVITGLPPHYALQAYEPLPDDEGYHWHFGPDREHGWWDRCPYGAPGDVLWCRETWRTWAAPIACDDGTVEDPAVGIEYQADRRLTLYDFSEPGTLDLETLHRYGRQYEADMEGSGVPRWRPSIHMPRWASRITLRVTDVRVERVQEITPEDAEAEGITERAMLRWMSQHQQEMPCGHDCWVGAFADLWDSINAKRGFGWDVNPYVWVVSFERVAQG